MKISTVKSVSKSSCLQTPKLILTFTAIKNRIVSIELWSAGKVYNEEVKKGDVLKAMKKIEFISNKLPK